MPIRVQIPGPMRPLTGGASEVEVEAADVAGLIAALESRHQGVRDRLPPAPGGASEVEVEAADVAGLIAALESRHQGVRDRLVDASGALRRHVRVFVND